MKYLIFSIFFLAYQENDDLIYKYFHDISMVYIEASLSKAESVSIEKKKVGEIEVPLYLLRKEKLIIIKSKYKNHISKNKLTNADKVEYLDNLFRDNFRDSYKEYRDEIFIELKDKKIID